MYTPFKPQFYYIKVRLRVSKLYRHVFLMWARFGYLENRIPLKLVLRTYATSKTTLLPMKLLITKTCLYNFDPLKPHFYIVKLGFTGVYIIFLFSLKNIDCGYSLQPPCRGGSNEYPQTMFWTEIWKMSEFLSENFQFFGGEIFHIFE